MEGSGEPTLVHHVLEDEVGGRAAAHVSIAYEENTMHPLYMRIHRFNPATNHCRANCTADV
jgi:hypothetical protein